MYLFDVVNDQPPSRAQVLSERIVLPGVYQIVVEFRGFNDRSPQRILSRDQGAAGRKKPASCIYDFRNTTSEKWNYTAEIGKYDVGPLGKRDSARDFFEEFNFFVAAVGCRNFTRHLNDFTRLDGIDSLSAKLARQYCENTGPRADFHNDGPLANGFAQGLAVGIHTHPIRDHDSIASQAIHRISLASMQHSSWVSSPVSHRWRWSRRGQKLQRVLPGDAQCE